MIAAGVTLDQVAEVVATVGAPAVIALATWGALEPFRRRREDDLRRGQQEREDALRKAAQMREDAIRAEADEREDSTRREAEDRDRRRRFHELLTSAYLEFVTDVLTVEGRLNDERHRIQAKAAEENGRHLASTDLGEYVRLSRRRLSLLHERLRLLGNDEVRARADDLSFAVENYATTVLRAEARLITSQPLPDTLDSDARIFHPRHHLREAVRRQLEIRPFDGEASPPTPPPSGQS